MEVDLGNVLSDGPSIATVTAGSSGTAGHALTGRSFPVAALAVAPDGSWLALASWDKTVRIWDPATGACRHTLSALTGAVEALAVAPVRSCLASGSWDHTVRIWDPATGACRHTLTGHTARVAALAVAPDGSWLASASWDYTVRFWDAATGRPAMSIRVGYRLHQIVGGAAGLTVAGDRGPYFFVIARLAPSDQAAPEQLV